MPVVIFKTQTGYELRDTLSSAYRVAIDCQSQINHYNSICNNRKSVYNAHTGMYIAQIDDIIRNDFANACKNGNASLQLMEFANTFSELEIIYTLYRNSGHMYRPYLRFAGIIQNNHYSALISSVNYSNNVHLMKSEYRSLSRQFTQALNLSNSLTLTEMSQVGLSKLLHFLNPHSFGIFDTVVGVELKKFKFSGTYYGLCDFLSSLIHDVNYLAFIIQLRKWNLPYIDPDLKLIDKLFWKKSNFCVPIISSYNAKGKS